MEHVRTAHFDAMMGLLFVCAALCVSCDRPSGISSRIQIGGPAYESIQGLLEPAELLSTIESSRFIEETRGDESAPTTRRVFMRVGIDPASTPRWIAHLKPLADGERSEFATPHIEAKWWPTVDPRPDARAVGSPTILKGSTQGWAMVSRDGSQVYLYSHAP